MLPSSFWSEKSSRSQGYESVNTDSTDGDHNQHDEIFPPEQNKTHSFDSDKEYNDEEQFKYRNPQNRTAWSLRTLIFVCAPVLDDIEIPFVHKQVHGELFPASNVEDQLLGRREPGPATDDLWLDYDLQRIFKLDREQVIAMGKDPELTVKLPDETFGLGPEAYMGGLDIFHVLHCYNSIRAEAFKDYYFDGEEYHMEGYGPESPPKRVHSEMFWIHLRHCNDIVVQFLMCNADTTMTTYSWVETQERPFPDFSVNKKCIDFDELVRWRDENTVDVDKAGLVRRPPGAREVPVSEMYWKIMGNETHPGDKRHHPLWD